MHQLSVVDDRLVMLLFALPGHDLVNGHDMAYYTQLVWHDPVGALHSVGDVLYRVGQLCKSG